MKLVNRALRYQRRKNNYSSIAKLVVLALIGVGFSSFTVDDLNIDVNFCDRDFFGESAFGFLEQQKHLLWTTTSTCTLSGIPRFIQTPSYMSISLYKIYFVLCQWVLYVNISLRFFRLKYNLRINLYLRKHA